MGYVAVGPGALVRTHCGRSSGLEKIADEDNMTVLQL